MRSARQSKRHSKRTSKRGCQSKRPLKVSKVHAKNLLFCLCTKYWAHGGVTVLQATQSEGEKVVSEPVPAEEEHQNPKSDDAGKAPTFEAQQVMVSLLHEKAHVGADQGLYMSIVCRHKSTHFSSSVTSSR